MRAVLEARQKAAAVRVEELEAELERVQAALADAGEVLGRRVIGLEQYLEALAEEEAPAVAVLSQRKPVGPRRAVPHRNDAAGAEVLSVDYQALMGWGVARIRGVKRLASAAEPVIRCNQNPYAIWSPSDTAATV
ncbi:hypothetical protein [Streptomyces sp. NPDC058476]|uniref:hypothetical protein n=1 Tax=Streptomyces sp. NPDC058476 TaxID=3346519 RepID=UPI003669DB99